MQRHRIARIVNPRGGGRRGMTILDQIKPLLSESGRELDVFVTQRAGHARQIARSLALERYGGLCTVGGDGTIHEIVSGLLERGSPAAIPLGVVPAGTGNDVARQLGISDSVHAARKIVAGHTRPFDVARVEACGRTEYCVTLIGWAGVAEVNRRAERMRMLGPPRYAIAALWQILLAKRHRARLVLDGRVLDGEFLLVVACNTIFSGSGMRLAPRARIDDGKLDVVILRRASRWSMLRLFCKVFDRSHTDMSCVEYHQVRSLSILSDDRMPLDLDGEIKGAAPASIEVIPGAMRVFS